MASSYDVTIKSTHVITRVKHVVNAINIHNDLRSYNTVIPAVSQTYVCSSVGLPCKQFVKGSCKLKHVATYIHTQCPFIVLC